MILSTSKTRIRHHQPGFTLVELLIVIIVIAILAAITIVAYNGIQARAHDAKIKSDINQIVKAIMIARNNESKTFGVITGNWGTGGPCWSKPSGTDLATLQATDSCWQAYNNTLSIINDKSSVNIRNMIDPWGRPYLLDENEGEGGGCVADTVSVYKSPFTTGFGTLSGYAANNVPKSGYSGCS